MSNNLTIIDGLGAQKVLKTTETDGKHATHHIIDSMPSMTLEPANIESLPVQHIDSFSRIRTSNPGYRFDAQLTYQIDSDLWDQSTTNGTITHSATERWAAMSCNANGANKAILQAHYHAPYTPGRGQLCFVTFLMGAAPGTGGSKRVGYFDGTNGIYLERTSSAVNLVCKSSTSHGTESIPQASWNIDAMDGNGPSGLTLDLTRVQILVIAMQALFVGRVVVGFDIGGQLVPVHQFTCANEDEYPYIAQASLPVRYEVNATADTNGAVTMKAICASVISEGGNDVHNMAGRPFAAAGSLTDASPKVAAVAIRCKPQLNSINQNALVVPTEIEAAVAAAGAWIEVRRNATITGGTFAAVDAGSVMEVSTPASSPSPVVVTADTGTLVDKFHVPASATSRTSSASALVGKALLSYSHLLGVGDNLCVIVDGGNTTEAQVAVKWKEIR